MDQKIFPHSKMKIAESMLSPLPMQLLILLLSVLKTEVAQTASPIANLGCKDTCGNVSVAFPFGIGANCFLDPWFEIDCKAPPGSKGFAKPFLSKLGIEVVKMDFNLSLNYFEKSLEVLIPSTNSCTTHAQMYSSIDLRKSPYHFSVDNIFVIEGCPGNAVMLNESRQVMAGCGTTCLSDNNAIPANSCYGDKCCQDQPHLDYLLQFYQIEFDSQSQNCLSATLVSSENLDDYIRKPSTSETSSAAPAQLSWVWSNLTFNGSSHHYTCSIDDIEGMICNCNRGYVGDPYSADGCQVDQGCGDCRGHCYEEDSYSRCYEEAKENKPHFTIAASLGLSISFGITLLVIGFYGLYRFIKRRREIKQRAKFFKRNGGLLMQQQLASKEGVVEMTKIFTPSELDKATDHFSENRILGQGGQGTVYKGMLADGRIVAVKKSKLLDKSQLKQFINEVVILSQINHRNVVKLLGCCLETEVPLLVYEFIPNGTLSQHIHDPDEDFFMSWEMRLKIAADSAGAIAYLHSSSSTPIYHRDIKSLNILLDDKYRAKVSDFGCSKTIAMDQTHLTTCVQGTWGYLDPEYFQSSQFTEKSDVYSFGVVLLELLTSKKPIYREETMEQKSLVIEFQNSKLFDMLDHEVVKEAKEEELVAIVELTRCCLCSRGARRPTMKEVAMTLEMIVKSQPQVSTRDKHGFLDRCGQNVTSLLSDEVFVSNPLPEGGGSALYINMRPLLPNTI